MTATKEERADFRRRVQAIEGAFLTNVIQLWGTYAVRFGLDCGPSDEDERIYMVRVPGTDRGLDYCAITDVWTCTGIWSAPQRLRMDKALPLHRTTLLAEVRLPSGPRYVLYAMHVLAGKPYPIPFVHAFRDKASYKACEKEALAAARKR